MKYIDMHCDTITGLYRAGKPLSDNDFHVDIKKMKKGECMLQNFAIFTNIAYENSSFTKRSIEFYHEELKRNEDAIRPIYTYDDIIENDRNGLMSAMLTLEEGSVVDGDLNMLDWYYDEGVRMITLTWNHPNGIGFPNFMVDRIHEFDQLHQINMEDGLTDFGIDFIRRCEEKGIIVDVSHLSDAGIYDVLRYSTKPFVASHSNARGVCPVARNLSDDMIVKMADRGCITGLNFCSAFIEDGNEKHTTIEGMVSHVRYLIDKGGIDFVGLGSDFDGIGNTLEIGDCSGIQQLYEALKPYYSEEELEKIFYRNVLRVYREDL